MLRSLSFIRSSSRCSLFRLAAIRRCSTTSTGDINDKLNPDHNGKQLYRAPIGKQTSFRFLTWAVTAHTITSTAWVPVSLAMGHQVSGYGVAVCGVAAGCGVLFYRGVRFFTKRYILSMVQKTEREVQVSTFAPFCIGRKHHSVSLDCVCGPPQRSGSRPYWAGMRVFPSAELAQQASGLHPKLTQKQAQMFIVDFEKGVDYREAVRKVMKFNNDAVLPDEE